MTTVLNLPNAVKVFVAKYWKRITIVLFLYNLFLWYGNIAEFHIEWVIMAIVMIAFSIVIVTIWSVQWNMNQEFMRRKAEERKSGA